MDALTSLKLVAAEVLVHDVPLLPLRLVGHEVLVALELLERREEHVQALDDGALVPASEAA